MANKSNKSAVVIIPPKSVWEQIQNIRSKFDKAYDRWMPHINLIYPFAPDSEFSNLLPRLKDQLQNVAPFTVVFTKDSIGYFEHGQRCGLWLKPLIHSQQYSRPTDSNHLQQLFPNFNDLNVINEKGFQPHLTLGQFKHNEIQRVVNDLKQNWKPVNFKVDEIFLISRKGFSDPFEIRDSVALGN
ncbi:hypothetical protein LOTGIDRAFT_106220 [Lottia gigantea]|uniref:2'-5' RNA ligase n=1 Tax=Lottia gigantea TaxID=225164 RepID=V4A6Y2_LOTGI|nr:hypothetical protein LOTGIDRAFT_106220 [Lottia gigantea]ESO89026.1 hypothetical protein LOTGIDRAFT_106220 [Lottia gigantea]